LALEKDISETVVQIPPLPELDLGIVGRAHDTLEKITQEEAAIETPLIEDTQLLYNKIHSFPAYVLSLMALFRLFMAFYMVFVHIVLTSNLFPLR